MTYSSAEFLLLFPAFLSVFWLLRQHRMRLMYLLIGSFLFYAYGNAAGLPVLLGVCAVTYFAGLAIARWDNHANSIAAITVTALVANLALVKYSGFIGSALPPGILSFPEVIVPLGVSFFTFEAIAYIIDLKRGMTDVERSPVKVGLYIVFFPHLIAGPILRADDLIPQLRRSIGWDASRFVSGLQLLAEGLIKKRLIADPVGVVADGVFASPMTVATTGAWIGLLAYTIQIYADFSGYTDMARGISRMIGLELPKNFNSPYIAHSVTEFWQRWHITLSSWLRDYVWIPLGGLKRGGYRAYYTVFLTMLIGGIWHGAGWMFFIWGAYQGAWLALERRWRWSGYLPRWLAIGLTLFIVMNGWVLFRSESLNGALALFQALYVPRGGWLPDLRDALYVLGAFAVVLGAMIVSLIRPAIADMIRRPTGGLWLAYGAAAAVAILAAPAATKPFIYFRF